MSLVKLLWRIWGEAVFYLSWILPGTLLGFNSNTHPDIKMYIRTDAGAGKKRNSTINRNTYVSISEEQSGPYPKTTPITELINNAQEGGYRCIVETGTGTFYLKCKREQVGERVMIATLARNMELGYKNGSTTYILNSE